MSESARPLISVIVPVYNGAPYLAQAVESVLAQGYAPIEILVVDDGSVDGTAQVAACFAEISYVKQERAGAAAARNRGVTLASGAYLAFLDADDLFSPGKLVEQARVLDTDPALDMVFGHVRQFRGSLANAGQGLPAKLPGSLLIRRSSFERAGGFRSEWRVGEFVEWYLRASEAGLKSAMLPQVVLERRLHDDNLGLRERNSRGDYAQIVKQALDRRRGR